MTANRSALSDQTRAQGVTRREAVARVGAAAGVASILLNAPNLAFAKGKGHVVHNSQVHAMTHADWEQLIGQTFHVGEPTFDVPEHVFPKRIPAKLIDVKDHKHPSDRNRPSNVRAAGYSLVFEMPSETNLCNVCRGIEHAQLGTFHLMLHEIHRGQDAIEYEENKKKKKFYEAVVN